MSDDIQTVLGPVPASHLGPTTIHEHLFVDLECWFDEPADDAAAALAVERVRPDNLEAVRANPFGVHDNLRLDDEELAASEVLAFHRAGGRTIVDLTLDEIGRDPARLVQLSRRTGVHVVMGCGHYIARAHPPGLADRGVEALTVELLGDLVEGIDVPGFGRVLAGTIGEIGTSDPIEDDELVVLEAACRAQLATGRALFVHLDPWGGNGHDVLDACDTFGAPLDRIVLCHMDPSIAHHHDARPETAYARSLARRGAWVAIDICGDEDAYGGRGMPTDLQRVEAVLIAHDEGWADRLVMAQDVCLKTQLRAFGGRGYDHVLSGISRDLVVAGLAAADVDRLFIEHPRRVLSGARPSHSPGAVGEGSIG
jgi:phosphotriesterase-related protein